VPNARQLRPEAEIYFDRGFFQPIREFLAVIKQRFARTDLDVGREEFRQLLGRDDLHVIGDKLGGYFSGSIPMLCRLEADV
jgi:hypothetical protein